MAGQREGTGWVIKLSGYEPYSVQPKHSALRAFPSQGANPAIGHYWSPVNLGSHMCKLSRALLHQWCISVCQAPIPQSSESWKAFALRFAAGKPNRECFRA